MQVRFTLDDAVRAADEWGANCGPGALAAVLGITLDQVRPLIYGFDTKRYTSPSMMFAALKASRRAWKKTEAPWPKHGLARVQWHGPWMNPGVPVRARYRHTHWVGAHEGDAGHHIFDINCICVGGWVHFEEWSVHVVPWLIKEL